jgi:hypothetical protein
MFSVDITANFWRMIQYKTIFVFFRSMKIIIKSPKAAIVKNIPKLTKYIASDKG